LLLSVCSLTQAPLQALYPVSHVNVHAPPTHAAWALTTLVEQELPQVACHLRPAPQRGVSSIDRIGLRVVDDGQGMLEGSARVRGAQRDRRSLTALGGRMARLHRQRPAAHDRAHHRSEQRLEREYHGAAGDRPVDL
jgi:hypothetical protein